MNAVQQRAVEDDARSWRKEEEKCEMVICVSFGNMTLVETYDNDCSNNRGHMSFPKKKQVTIL